MQRKPEVRYDMRLTEDSTENWTVYDVFTGKPAVVDGTVMDALDMDEADDLVDLLNAEYNKRKESTTH